MRLGVMSVLSICESYLPVNRQKEGVLKDKLCKSKRKIHIAQHLSVADPGFEGQGGAQN